MCGIVGGIGDVDDRWVRQCVAALAHRGPDGEGFWRRTSTAAIPGPQVSLGHRRLAVIDTTAAGTQPMIRGDLVISWNGELYNYLELRQELKALGQAFRTESDTEVVLAAYQQWGNECFQRFIGMWAIALWDELAKQLVLSRDQFGVKPLFYSFTNTRVLFASEIEPLLRHRGVGRDLNATYAYNFLRWGDADVSNESLVDGIVSVPAATTIVVSFEGARFRLRQRQFWSVSSQPEPMTDSEAAQSIRGAFLESVRLHLRSDVPLGFALSGGVDSSAILAVARLVGTASADLHAFTFVAKEKGIDESHWSKLAANHTNAHRHVIDSSEVDVVSFLPSLIARQAEPFGGLSIAAQFAVFAEAKRQGITVMLDGQGADEIFGGYPTFLLQSITDLARSGRVHKVLPLLSAAVRLCGRASVLSALLRSFPLGVGAELWSRWVHSSRPRWIADEWFEVRGVATGRIAAKQRLFPSVRELRGAAVKSTSLPALLRYEDRNSMANSVESRVPFLTPQLAEIGNSLSAKQLVDDSGVTKGSLRLALRGLVPDTILDRRDKVAFAPPSQWNALVPSCDHSLPFLLGDEAPKTASESWKLYSLQQSIESLNLRVT
jgi:asparagine synthase (glutamine-hydrolysing)